MPAVDSTQTPFAVPQNAFRVLITGFGPFMNYEENPSWLAVKPLQNTILHTDAGLGKHPIRTPTTSIPTKATQPILRPSTPVPIHISALRIPVIYETVLDVVPGLHARPPVLPADTPADCTAPPHSAYDFIFHVGVAGRGPLRMERLGHKLGYQMKDASGKLAPVVKVSTKDFSRRSGDTVGGNGVTGGSGMVMSAAESAERERLGMDMGDTTGDAIIRPTRGFGKGYEQFQEEYTTDIDVTRLVQDLKLSGVEQIYTSMDAGHYLCDFIYYCSLAEAKRSSKPYEKRRNTQVLFLHCPPVGQPLKTEEVTDAIKKIVVWVCGEQQVDDEREEAAHGVVGGEY